MRVVELTAAQAGGSKGQQRGCDESPSGQREFWRGRPGTFRVMKEKSAPGLGGVRQVKEQESLGGGPTEAQGWRLQADVETVGLLWWLVEL